MGLPRKRVNLHCLTVSWHDRGLPVFLVGDEMIKWPVALLAGILLASPATAATFVKSTAGPDTTPPSGLLTINFNSANTLSDIPGLSGNGQIVQGFLPGVYAQPYLDVTKYLSVPQSGSGGTATLNLTGYNFSGIVKGFSFYWGSIDTYNSLNINTSSGTTTFSFDGSNPPPPANGAQLTSENNRRVFFSLASGETLKSLEFVSNGYAMEIDDLVFTGIAVPEPATWAMMILGFGFVGGAMRSAKRARKPARAYA